jgi:putative ABC transport system ATP-binding protein
MTAPHPASAARSTSLPDEGERAARTVAGAVPEALITLQGVSKTYQRDGASVLALSRVNLLIHAGEFTAVMGRSGSGKSTLLHILGLLDAEYEGTYHFDGQLVSGVSPDDLSPLRNRKIGFVFQSFHLLPQLTILENAALPALYAGRLPRECRAAARRRLDQMGLSDRLDHRPMELSIGQRQRAAIARALVNEPRVLLADEPTGALDSRTAMEILEILHELHRGGVTVVLITHDREVSETAERIIHITDGKTDDGVA